MQIYDITIAPNNVQEVASQGRYIYYYNGSAGGADASITVKHDMSGTAIVLKPGQAFRLDDKERGGGRWLIGNYANTAPILGRIVVGNGRIDDNTITGSVEVIDGGKNRTKAGMAFMMYANQVQTAGQVTINQLWNPVGSGKNAIVERINLTCGGTAQAIVVRLTNTPLPGATGCQSKLVGGPVSSCVVQGVSQAGLATGTVVWAMYFAANSTVTLPLSEPIILPPGSGISASSGQPTGLDVPFSVEFYEESI